MKKGIEPGGNSSGLTISADRKLVFMRGVALTALLICATGLIACRIFEDVHYLIPWARAFCEAGTIGALADWFAVVALFRHPLGIPIPHTAILPNNKQRVAATLSRFIESNFLTEERIRPRLERIDFATPAASWLRENAGDLARRAMSFAPGIIDGINSAEASAMLARQARLLISQADLAPAAGAAIETFLQGGRDRELFSAALRIADDLVIQNRQNIRDKIREEIPISAKFLKDIPLLEALGGPLLEQIGDSIAEMVAEKTIEKVQRILEEAERHPDHALWQGFERQTRKLVDSLKSSPEMAAKVNAARDAALAGSLIDDFAAKTWRALCDFIASDCQKENSEIVRRVAGALKSGAEQIEASPELRDGLNNFLRRHLTGAVLAARPHVGELIVSTVESWDGAEMAAKLENSVGSDLQFIRLNGTLIGGLIGVLIHAAFFLLLPK